MAKAMTHEERLRRITVLWWLFNTRWITVTAILIFLAMTHAAQASGVPYPVPLMTSVPLFFDGSTALALFWLRPNNRSHINDRGLRILGGAIIPIDLVLLTIVYFVTGGIAGWGKLLFFYIPVLGIILFEHTKHVVLTGAVTLFYVASLATLDIAGVIQPVNGGPIRELLLATPSSLWLDTGGFFAVFLGIVGVSSLSARGFHASEEIAHREFTMFTKALEGLPDAVVLFGRQRGITFMNRRAEELFRIKRDMVLDRPVEQLISHDAARLRSALLLEVSEGDASLTRFTVPEGDGERTFVVSRVPLSLKKGYGNELRIFRETTREEEVSKLKSKFMSVAAHQLRTPVAGLKWVIQMILNGEAGAITDTQREFLGRAAQTAERMIRLISDLLDVTRIEEGRFAYDFEVQQDFVGMVEGIVNPFKAQAKDKGIGVEFVTPKDPIPPLLIDKSRLTIAIENIVQNAFKYTQQGSVTVSIQRRPDDVALIVRDTGVGIPKDEMEKMFAKFYRGRNVQEQGIEGTGLGLFITKAILKRHGGNIAVDSEEGKGSTFTITLPIDPTRVPSGDVPIDEAVV